MSDIQQQQFNENDVEILGVETVYDGFFRMLEYQLRHRLFQGGWSQAMSRELFERGDAVVVLPYDPVSDQLIVLEQFRVGALQSSNGPWLLEFVAGMIKSGESLLDVAQREAEEEAGIQLGRLEKVAECLVSPGGTSECLHIFCAEVSSQGIGGIHGLDIEHEDIRVQGINYPQALEWLHQGRFNSAGPLIAMQWLVMNRERLRQQWLTTS